MPWNQQGGGGGGPWGGNGGGGGGGGGQNPWGGRGVGGGGGPTPPNLEEMIRRGQDRVRNALPKGFGGGRGIFLIILILIGLWLLSGFYRVQEDQRGVVLRFGAFTSETGPGLHYHWPWPIESVERPTVTRINRIDLGFQPATTTTRVVDRATDSLMLTGDENVVDINFSVLWRINSATDYLFNINDPVETLRVATQSTMREVMGQTDIQPALTEARSAIEHQVREMLQATMDGYRSGILVTEVQLQTVDPPREVIDSFNDVQRARQELDTLRNEAQAYANNVLPQASGEAESIIQAARAYREEVVARARGDAERFLAVLDAYRVAPEITAQRLYIETMQEVFQGVRKIILDDGVTGAAGGSGIVPYLPLDMLRPGQPAMGGTVGGTGTFSPPTTGGTSIGGPIR